MTMPALSDEENARLYAQAMARGYAPPAPAAPASAPLDAGLAALQNPQPAAPQRPMSAGMDLSAMPPSSLSNAHTKPPGWSDPTRALAPEQTVGYSGPPPGAGMAPQSAPPQPAMLSTTTGGASTQKGIKLSEQTKRAEADMFRAGEREAKLQEEGQPRVQGARVAGMNAEIEAMQASNATAQRQSDEHAAKLAEKRAALDAMNDDIANEKVDPGRWFHDASVVQKIGAVIAMVAGGFQGGYSHTPNEGAKLVRGLIDDDVAAQRDNIQSKRAAVAEKSKLYDMTKTAFHDETERSAAARLGGLAVVQKQADLALTVASDPLERAKIEAMKRDVAKEQMQLGAHLDSLTADKTTTHSSTTSAPNPAAGASVVDPKLLVTGPDGRQFVANTETEAKTLRTQSAATSNIQANIDKALQLRKQISLTSPLEARNVVKQLKSLQAETAQLVTVQRGQGAMSKGDQEVADQAVGAMVPDIFDQLGMGASEKVLESTRTRFLEQFDRAAASQSGGRPWTPPAPHAGGRR